MSNITLRQPSEQLRDANPDAGQRLVDLWDQVQRPGGPDQNRGPLRILELPQPQLQPLPPQLLPLQPREPYRGPIDSAPPGTPILFVDPTRAEQELLTRNWESMARRAGFEVLMNGGDIVIRNEQFSITLGGNGMGGHTAMQYRTAEGVSLGLEQVMETLKQHGIANNRWWFAFL